MRNKIHGISKATKFHQPTKLTYSLGCGYCNVERKLLTNKHTYRKCNVNDLQINLFLVIQLFKNKNFYRKITNSKNNK